MTPAPTGPSSPSSLETQACTRRGSPPAGLLSPGRYMVEVWLGTEFETFFEQEVLNVNIAPRIDDRQTWIDHPGVVAPDLPWQVRQEPTGTEAVAAVADVSVVVRTIGRPVLLEKALASLARCQPRPAEVLVVDQSEELSGAAVVDAPGWRGRG